MNKLHPCPCCGEKTFAEVGEFDICYICKWEYDPLQSKDPTDDIGANSLCLNDYKKEWMHKKLKQPQNLRTTTA